MDAGVLGRSSSATMEGTDLKAVRHREWGVIVRFMAITRREKFGYPSWELVAAFVPLIHTTKPWFVLSATAQCQDTC